MFSQVSQWRSFTIALLLAIGYLAVTGTTNVGGAANGTGPLETDPFLMTERERRSLLDEVGTCHKEDTTIAYGKTLAKYKVWLSNYAHMK